MDSGPGRSERQGLSLAELFVRFPDDETAVRRARLAGRGALPRLRLCRHSDSPDPQAAALPVPLVPLRLLGEDRHGHARVEDRLSEVGRRDLPHDHEPEGRWNPIRSPRPAPRPTRWCRCRAATHPTGSPPLTVPVTCPQ